MRTVWSAISKDEDLFEVLHSYLQQDIAFRVLFLVQLILICFQDDSNSLVFWPLSFVAHSLQISLDMHLIRGSTEAQNPARLRLILKTHWNQLPNFRSK
jgi:hypothetical protein